MKTVLVCIIRGIVRGMIAIRRAYRRMSPTQKCIMYVMIFSIIVGGILGGLIGRAVEKKKAEESLAVVSEQIRQEEKKKLDAVQKELYDLKEQLNETDEPLPWNLTLVNWENPMVEGYVPELTEIEEGISVDKRIADAAREMLADAKAAGLHPIVCSSYRSVQRQGNLFSDTMKEHVKAGMSYWEAYQETSRSVAVPGTSEHAMGLALDIISNKYMELDEGQEQTDEAKWFAENCYKYGFILRYPPEKTSITGIIYEPWHYRYVGTEHAEKITELNITLEEYLQDYYQSEGGK